MQTSDTRPPSMIEILRKLVVASPPPPRAVGGPRLSVLLGDPARFANDIERDRMKGRPLDVAATAASLSPGLVRVLLLGLDDTGHGVPMWALTGITGHDIAWCRSRSETLSRWGLVRLEYPDDGRDHQDWKIRLTSTGRAVARRVMLIAREFRRHD
ncbi:hypothetical protein [Methylorubrum extorquens]|uniref:MarR family transcriptional regulator n=1 Tax=Methylorubrum extorquens (strain DSM 6343 / CIP 106787 / DM4) TaxID=661410 RepID=C7CFC9_METED|nr:hypothetical protein [Methylorubrum extorquens]UYW30360.1 hypothetical protein OKB92_15245 [Methylorubrum extorquens]CAX26063.1 protein of unknown function [Methylorubrum extorquens DM4]